MLTTGTASGKSLGYLLPILAATYSGGRSGDHVGGDTEAIVVDGPEVSDSSGGVGSQWRQRPHTALYLAPTKALAHDQLRRGTELGLDRWRIAAVDGDTSLDERDWARDYASFIVTNPDLLHHSLLPGHPRWRGVLQSLRYVVIDEAHRYRGVFGAHVAAVLRRLRRLAAHYGAYPTFVLASATGGDAAATAAALTGLDANAFTLIDRDSSTRGTVAVSLWQADERAEDLTTDLLTEEVAGGRQAIAFVASRRSAEAIALTARGELQRRGLPPHTVEAYRGGYLAMDRRRIETDLQTGRLRGIAATNALELGVDIAGVDTVVICGYPGSRAALWQQAGRAGRRGHDAVVHVVARRQPLDAYLLDHPGTLFDADTETTVVHPANPYVLGPHLAAAAQELPITDADRTFFGDSGLALADHLAATGRLRKRPGGYFWTHPERAADTIDLRSAGGDAVDLIEESTGRVLGHVDAAAADLMVHPGAVYLHLGETYLCEDRDPGDREVFVRAARPGFLTQAQQESDVVILVERAHRALGRGAIHRGEVEVTSQVTSYLRYDQVTGRVWDSTPLDLPARRSRTTAAWWTLAHTEVPAEVNVGSTAQLDAAVHAAEHVCLGLLPAFAPCDRWDVGAFSDPEHRQTGAVTVFVHDQQAGGTGFADRAYEVAEEWLQVSLERVRDCDCDLGCPACILTACGSNRGLDRAGATELLRRLVP